VVTFFYPLSDAVIINSAPPGDGNLFVAGEDHDLYEGMAISVNLERR